jgi:hypothetical protein
MVVDIDLVQPFRPRRAGLMAPHAHADVQLGQFLSRIRHMGAARTVAGFARKCFVFALGQFPGVVGMTLQA